MENENILTIKDLDVRLFTDRGELPVIDRLSLSLQAGETLGIVGESGCGKSMLASAIMGLVAHPGKVTGGSIRFGGQELVGMKKRDLRKIRGTGISMIFQEPMTSLNPLMTCGRQIMETITSHEKVSKAEAKERALSMIRSVGIARAEKVFSEVPAQLSGGMRQRIMIAMALICRPRLLICDEPTTALDVTVQAQILGLICRLQKETGTSVIFISHDMGVISQMADRVAVMYAGQLVEYADAEKIFSEPKHPYTQGLQAAIPRLDEQKDTLRSIPGNVPMLYELPKGCIFFPRCAFATERCHAERPGLVETEGHLVRCFQYEASESEKEQDVSEKDQAVQHDDRNAGSAAQGAEQKDEKGGAQV